jgi:hypothetical protein
MHWSAAWWMALALRLSTGIGRPRDCARTLVLNRQAEGVAIVKTIRHHLTFAILACVVLACGESASPSGPRTTALAERNGGPPEPVIPGAEVLNAFLSRVCGYPMTAVFTGRTKFIVLSRNRFIATGPGDAVTLTNLATGATQTLNIAGTFHITFLPNGLIEYVGTGRNFFSGVSSSIFIGSGRFTFVADPATNFVVEPLHGTGQLTDVCDLLR